jgi:hypothetical protein
VAYTGKSKPFFFDFNRDQKRINERPEDAKKELLARDPVLYQKTCFRAFLNLGPKEIKKMTLQEYMDYTVMLSEVLKLWHAPFQKEE